jgi:hypothetical protein
MHEAMDAGMMGWSCQRFGQNSMQADFDGTPMPTDVVPDETLLAFADVLAERGEGFIEMINATTGEPGSRPTIRRTASSSKRSRAAPAVRCCTTPSSPWTRPAMRTVHHAALKWLDAASPTACGLWPGGDGARALPVHARALESLRFEPGLE